MKPMNIVDKELSLAGTTMDRNGRIVVIPVSS